MTDDLVKRLRDYPTNEDGFIGIEKTCEEAADRIEQLEAALREICSIPSLKSGSASHSMIVISAAARGEKNDG